MRNRLIGLLAVLGLLLVGCGGGYPQAADPSEGIQVHGDWTFDILNPDGSLDRHVEFSNALTVSGTDLLIRALAGLYALPGTWDILLRNQSGSLCPSTGSVCAVRGSLGLADLDEDGKNDVLRLSGSRDVEIDGVIDRVDTVTYSCSGNVAPDDCAVGSVGIQFTAKTLDTPEPVSAGQSVQVTVEFSFSS